MNRNAMVGLLMLAGAGYVGYWIGTRRCRVTGR